MMPPLVMPPILQHWTPYLVFGLFGICVIASRWGDSNLSARSRHYRGAPMPSTSQQANRRTL